MAQALELSAAPTGGLRSCSGDLIGDDDEYTGAHSKGVVELFDRDSPRSCGFLRRSSVPRSEFGALLHDVGKIAIPKEIINKPGKLDEDEWRVMKTHTIEGQRMLDQVGGSLLGVWVSSSAPLTSRGTAAVIPTASRGRPYRWQRASSPPARTRSRR